MSYEAEVLADNPALYYRLDMTGIAANGDPIPDISVNSLDATLELLPGTAGGPGVAPGFPVVYGHTSPIETDGSSVEFSGHNFGIFGDTERARISRASHSLIEPTLEATIEGWPRLRRLDMGFVGFGDTIGQPLFGKDQSLGIYVDHFDKIGAYCYDTAGNLWHTSTLLGALVDESYYCVGRVIGNVLQIWINGSLAGQTTITSGLPLAAGDDFYIHPLQISAADAYYDEVALYLHPLSSDRILAHYEAAQNNPPINCRADLHLIATLDGTDEPDPKLFPLSHNWETEVREELSWLTDIIPAAQDYEQASGIRQRPLRSFELDYAILDNREQRKLDAFLFQNQRRTVYARIETDTVQLTAPASSGAGSLTFPAEHYDFDDDTKVALVDVNDETHFEIATLDTVGNTSSTLAGVTTKTWPTGTLVVPIRRALMRKEIDVRRHTDAMKDVSIVFDILPEDVALTPRRNGTYTPRYTYKGIEVFDPFVIGTNNFNDTGRGKVTVRAVDPESPAGVRSRTPEDTASREIVSYKFFLDARADIARFFGWLWSIQGRRVPLWVPTLQEDFIPVSTAGALPVTLTVETNDYTDLYENHEARRDLVLVYNDETMAAKRISSAAASGANDILTIEQVGAISLSNLLCASFLKLSRLNEDTIGLAWHTDQLLEVTLNFIDLLTTPE